MDRRGALTLMLGSLAAAAARADERPARDAVRLFAAASLKPALDDIAGLWGAPLSISYGASSTLARQIERGAPADLFLSANVAWMDHLQAQGAIDADARRTLVSNRLALVAGPGAARGLVFRSEIDRSVDLIRALGDGRLATGRVATVPLGLYARAALTSLGFWAAASARLAEAENARVAVTYVARGEAPLGIVYASDAPPPPTSRLEAEREADEAARLRLIGLFPERAHPPILYPAALTSRGAERVAARDVLAFLGSEPVAAVFRARGFKVPTV